MSCNSSLQSHETSCPLTPKCHILLSVFWRVNTFLEITCLISNHCNIWLFGSLTENTTSKFAEETKEAGSRELRLRRSLHTVISRIWHLVLIPSQSGTLGPWDCMLWFLSDCVLFFSLFTTFYTTLSFTPLLCILLIVIWST